MNFKYYIWVILLVSSAVLLCGGQTALAQESAAAAAIVPASGPLEVIFFWVLAIMIIGSALWIALTGSVVRMAVGLFFSFGGVALLFFLLQAYFLGVVQLIVYVGGILVLVVFGIMLTSSSPHVRYQVPRMELATTGLVSLLLFMVLGHVLYHAPWSTTGPQLPVSMNELGRGLLTDYLVPFELAGVVLLVVMVGAAYLARQEKR
ncbi:MAG: hypothetical protein HJJLKODD_00676 [Phycisphaerae bacterium]|nr:hypothetical protein [Phycisphaerae bacterium]